MLLAEAVASTGKLGGAVPLQVPFMRIFVAILICGVLALALALAIKRRGGPFQFDRLALPFATRTENVRILEVKRISMHGDIALIQHQDRRYLLVVQAGSATLLREELVPAEEVAA